MRLKIGQNLFDFTEEDEVPEIPEQPAIYQIFKDWKDHRILRMTTSGSTGTPKPVELPEKLIRRSVTASAGAMHLNKEKALLCLSPEKVGGAMVLLRGLLLNWEVEVAHPVANPLSDISGNHDFTFISLVPYQLSKILETNDTEKLLQFKTVLIGGGSVPASVEEKILALSPNSTRFFHSYGMTETASHVALRQLGQTHFTVLPGIQLSVDNEGCLKIKMEDAGVDLVTNDLVELNGNQFRFTGRRDDVVNSGGIKLHAEELHKEMDDLFHREKMPVDFILTKLPDEQWGEALVIIVCGNVLKDRLKEILEQHCDPVKIPKRFFKTESWVFSESGKILKAESLKRSVEI
ncbi:MAG: AMP-binding protein [Bacteroidetes bacterium]|nr:AMP-binding protein [Bacteroidota bacterium]